MKRTIQSKIVAITILGCIVIACGNPKEELFKKYHEIVSSVGPLDDATVVKYVKTMRILRARGIQFEQWLKDHPEGGQEGFDHIEGATKEGGFPDFATFVKVNAKVAWAWNMAQAEIGMERQKNLNQWAQDSTDQGIALIDEQLRDPSIPEETKAELRKTREQLAAQKETIKNTWDDNKKWADWAMETVGPLTNDEEVAVVKRHESELMEVFTGLSKEELDAIHEYSMPQLNLK